MKAQLEQLKAELREFIELSKTITQGPWKNDGGDLWQDIDGRYGEFTGLEINRNCRTKLAHRNATFIIRSRNISPALAECLLSQIEWLERFATPVDSANNQLKKLLTIWEASK